MLILLHCQAADAIEPDFINQGGDTLNAVQTVVDRATTMAAARELIEKHYAAGARPGYGPRWHANIIRGLVAKFPDLATEARYQEYIATLEGLESVRYDVEVAAHYEERDAPRAVFARIAGATANEAFAQSGLDEEAVELILAAMSQPDALGKLECIPASHLEDLSRFIEQKRSQREVAAVTRAQQRQGILYNAFSFSFSGILYRLYVDYVETSDARDRARLAQAAEAISQNDCSFTGQDTALHDGQGAAKSALPIDSGEGDVTSAMANAG